MQLITKSGGFTFRVVEARYYGFNNAVAMGKFDEVLLVTDKGKTIQRHKCAAKGA